MEIQWTQTNKNYLEQRTQWKDLRFPDSFYCSIHSSRLEDFTMQ